MGLEFEKIQEVIHWINGEYSVSYNLIGWDEEPITSESRAVYFTSSSLKDAWTSGGTGTEQPFLV